MPSTSSGVYTYYVLGYDAGTDANQEVIAESYAPGVPGIPADPDGQAGIGGAGLGEFQGQYL
jgi:hypothetical protein